MAVAIHDASKRVTDPFRFLYRNWPGITLYDKQAETVESVIVDEETVVPAANDLGKDFIAGFIAVWFQCSRYPCRIVSTSSSHAQLKDVLWGEIGRFIETSLYPLPIEENVMWLRTKIPVKDARGRITGTNLERRSYHRGRVAQRPESLQGAHLEWGNLSAVESAEMERTLVKFRGHHLEYDGLPRTLAIIDEASGVERPFYDAMDTWAHRKLLIGNTLECEMFKSLVEGGDILSDDEEHE